eukprot:12213440-Ditylum_brightwellii.AAC.1
MDRMHTPLQPVNKVIYQSYANTTGMIGVTFVTKVKHFLSIVSYWAAYSVPPRVKATKWHNGF